VKTLLLRLEGPMQSWGNFSRFTERDTGLEPSKSGVLGLICAALGKPRQESPDNKGPFPPLADLAALRMGVREDYRGKVGVDFQTAGAGKLGGRSYGVAKANGSASEPVMSWRYFLQDASFLAGLESEDIELLSILHKAVSKPVWQLYLGRKSYVPGTSPFLPDGLQEGKLEDVLMRYPLSKSVSVDDNRHLRLIIESADGRELRNDVPLDFARRRFGHRYVNVETIPASSFVRR
jgi:CRISPR system Cascade subunit CasD